MYETSTAEELDVMPDWDKSVPCSGTGHSTGWDRHLHGDPSQPAEWLVRFRCTKCPHFVVRPVCDFFKEHGITDRTVICSRCSCHDAADRFFTVLFRL